MGLFDFFKKKLAATNSNLQKRSEEIELFELANNCVSRLSKEFKRLPPTGKAEALLFFSTIVVKLPKLSNYIVREDVDKKYMLLLCDNIKSKFLVDDFYVFANNRVDFYKFQYDKVKREMFYTPMFIYNAFYMNPGCENPRHLREFNEPPTVLLKLQAKLYEIEDYIIKEKRRIYNKYHL